MSSKAGRTKTDVFRSTAHSQRGGEICSSHASAVVTTRARAAHTGASESPRSEQIIPEHSSRARATTEMQKQKRDRKEEDAQWAASEVAPIGGPAMRCASHWSGETISVGEAASNAPTRGLEPCPTNGFVACHAAVFDTVSGERRVLKQHHKGRRRLNTAPAQSGEGDDTERGSWRRGKLEPYQSRDAVRRGVATHAMVKNTRRRNMSQTNAIEQST